MRCHYTPSRRTKVNKTVMTRVGEDEERLEPSCIAVGMQHGQPLQETVWQFLVNVKIHMTYHPTILLLHIYPRVKEPKRSNNNKKHSHEDLYLNVERKIIYNGPLLETVQMSIVGEGMSKLQSISTTECYSPKRQSRTLCDSYQRQRGTPTTWRVARIITVPATRSGSPNTSFYCILASELPRKTQHTQTLGGAKLSLTQRRHRAVSAPTVCVSLSGLAGAPGSWCRGSGLPAPSVLQQTDPDPPMWRLKCWKLGPCWGLLTYVPKQKQGKRFPHKAVSLAWALCAPCLLGRKFCRPKVHSSVAEQSKDCMYRLSLPTKKTAMKYWFMQLRGCISNAQGNKPRHKRLRSARFHL